MTEDRGVLREVAWQEVFHSVLLLSIWKTALNLRVLVFAVVGLLATSAGWSLLDTIFAVDPESALQSSWTLDSLDSRPKRSENLDDNPTVGPTFSWSEVPVVRAWSDFSRPFIGIFSQQIGARRFVYLLLSGLWMLAVWAFAGGAISRFAAVELARHEKLSWGQAIGYARTKWPSYFAAPLFPLVGVLLASIPLAIIGLIMRAGGIGILLAAILWPLALVAGVVMAILAVGLVFNWPLMWATISAEGTDAFDALSRSYAYSFQRPFRYLGYFVVAAIVGLLSWLLVSMFAAAVLQLSQWAIAWGSGTELVALVVGPEQLGGLGGFGAKIIRLWNWLIPLFATAYAFSFFWVAATGVYFLLRYHVDATELDEVYLPDEDEPYGLPPLSTDAAGVPKVADAAGDEANAANGSPEG